MCYRYSLSTTTPRPKLLSIFLLSSLTLAYPTLYHGQARTIRQFDERYTAVAFDIKTVLPTTKQQAQEPR